MLFYVSIPFMTRKYLFVSLAILLHIISFFISYDFVSVGSYTHYALYFGMGFFLYEVLISHHGDKLKQLLENNSDIVVILSFIFLLLSIVLGLFHFEKSKDDIAMLSAIFFMLWILLGRETGLYLLAKKVVVNKASNFLGKISFSLYLTHAPFMVLLYSTLNIYSGEIVYYSRIYWLTLFFIIPFAYLFYRFFESPSLLLLKRHKLIYGMNVKT
jgi:peptidoglycan/LPS O-acetylase OafA/YrhL